MIKIAIIISLIIFSSAGIFFWRQGYFAQKKSQLTQTLLAPPLNISRVSSPSAFQPPVPEEECIGTYLGVPSVGAGEEPPKYPPITHTTCQKIYTEEHLSFNYPCNWRVIPKVEKEKSPTCGRIRDFYLLPDNLRQENLAVYPKDTVAANWETFTVDGYLKKPGYFTSSGGTFESLCTAKAVGTITGFTCGPGYSFYGKTGNVFLQIRGDIGYKEEFEQIIKSLKPDY